MRVTSEMMVSKTLQRLSSRLEQYEKVQSQLSTGKRYATPSEDASATARSLSLRGMQRAREQEARNAADARSWLDIADSQLQSAVTRLHRARDLAVRGASDTDPQESKALAAELRTIQAELVGIANFQHGGRPIFAGSQGVAPVSFTEDPITGARTWSSTGDDGKVERRVGDADIVQVNVTAQQAFGIVPGGAGGVFADLDALIRALESGDKAAVGAGIAAIDTAQNRLMDSLTFIGASTNWVDSAQRRSVDALHSIRTELSQVEDTDFAEAVMNLQVQETAYQATLQAIARALPPSLASFLR
jgi:flagellar hook-associated protein 3 FlgL